MGWDVTVVTETISATWAIWYVVCSYRVLDLYSRLNPIQLFEDVRTFRSDFKKIM